MARKKKTEDDSLPSDIPQIENSPPQTTKPEPAQPVKRNADGTFAVGHAKTGGIQKGQHQKLSIAIQNKVLNMVMEEVDSDRFKNGLSDLFFEDSKAYFQVLTAMLKYCTPTLQSQSLEINDNTAVRTIDDRLDQLMKMVKN